MLTNGDMPPVADRPRPSDAIRHRVTDPRPRAMAQFLSHVAGPSGGRCVANKLSALALIIGEPVAGGSAQAGTRPQRSNPSLVPRLSGGNDRHIL